MREEGQFFNIFYFLNFLDIKKLFKSVLPNNSKARLKRIKKKYENESKEKIKTN